MLRSTHRKDDASWLAWVDRMGSGSEGPTSTFGGMAFRERYLALPSRRGGGSRPSDKVHPPQRTPPPLRQPSNLSEAAAANASAEVHMLETAISALGRRAHTESLWWRRCGLPERSLLVKPARVVRRGSDQQGRLHQHVHPSRGVPATDKMWKAARKQGVWCAETRQLMNVIPMALRNFGKERTA